MFTKSRPSPKVKITNPIWITLFCMAAFIGTLLIASSSRQTAYADEDAAFSWWPLAINNWWEYKQTDIGISPDADEVNYPGCASQSKTNWGAHRTAWWVMPPDLTFRGDESKSLTMFKTHKCLYNFRGYRFNIRWSMRHEGNLGIVESNPLSVKWLTQAGVSRFETGTAYSPTNLSEQLPFDSTTASYFRDTEINKTPGGVRRQPTTATNLSYALLPPSIASSTPSFSVNAPDYYIQGPTPTHTPVQKWQELQSYTYKNVNGNSNQYVKWYSEFRFIQASTALGWSDLPSSIRNTITPNALLLEATYAEGLLGNTPNNFFCERWYYAKDIGPILINYTRIPPEDSGSISECLDYFDASNPTNYSRIFLNSYSVSGGLGYDDSPDAVANTEFSGESELFYIQDGFWWTYKMGNGRLYTHGSLIDIWGDKICPGCPGPYPYSPGNKVAAVWSPSYAQHISGDSNARFVIFIDGKYWVWRQTTSNNKWFATGSSTTLLQNAPVCPNGKTVYQNNGPTAVDQTNDGLGIHFYNEGCVWKYAPVSGTWTWVQNQFTPNLVSTTYSQMPAVDGYKPQNPEAAIQFVGGEYLVPGRYEYPSNWAANQHLLFEKGRIWMTDNANHFENWGNVWN